MRSDDSRQADRGNAFTLVELLVVLAILIVLACLTLPGLARAQRQARVTQCVAQLRQLASVQFIYADDNNGRLPSAPGTWPWDLPSSYANALVTYGFQRKGFYCPANGDNSVDGLWNYPDQSIRLTGYSFTLSSSVLIASNANLTILPQQLIVNGAFVLSAPLVRQRVFVADVVLSQAGQNSTTNKLNYTYTGIQGGFPIPHRTSHMDMVNRYPAGANVVMLDGHAEWRPFSNVICRTQGGTPGFWW